MKNHKKALLYGGIFLAGVILSGKVRSLPVIGPKIPVV